MDPTIPIMTTNVLFVPCLSLSLRGANLITFYSYTLGSRFQSQVRSCTILSIQFHLGILWAHVISHHEQANA